MAKLILEQIPVLRDNYVYLVHDPASGATAAIDPALAEPVLERLAARGWRLTHILNTHHHWDHTDGNLPLKDATGARVIGAAHDAARIRGLDDGVADGDTFPLGTQTATVFAVPGHTSGHIAFWFADSGLLFCGDTLFSLGCGRLFEGSAEQMWASLRRLRALPDDTLVCCAHEYTAANGRFARAVDPANPALAARLAEVERLEAEDRPTIPTRLAIERATNPFLRADEPALAAAIGMEGAKPAAVFAELRRRKDGF